MNSNFTTVFFFFNDTATTEIYTLSLHDALPICLELRLDRSVVAKASNSALIDLSWRVTDRKSTRLNSSHLVISYAVFCLKKKKQVCRTCRLKAPTCCRQAASILHCTPYLCNLAR